MQQPTYHHTKPVAHRTHKKSSTGCRACKLRKVKCDEEHPVCRKCRVHFSNIEKCDYEQAPRKSRGDHPKENRDIGSPGKERVLEPLSSKAESPVHLQVCEFKPQLSTGVEQYVYDRTERTLTLRKAQIQLQKKLDCRGFELCQCPCHATKEYADMLSDALFGICRICRNFPSWTTSLEQCCPVISPKILQDSRVDPFGVLPIRSSPSVNSLMYHWVNTLALFPTKIHSNYCTNPTWLSAAISNAALFNVTLYTSSLHVAGLNSQRESQDSLYYKAQTVKALNECLKDETQALKDETIAAVLCLLFVVCVTGDEQELEAHIRGLKQMIKLRGGIHDFIIEGVFLHMLCTTNHITAVLAETPSIQPITGPPVTSRKCIPAPLPPSTPPSLKIRTSDVWHDFGIRIGFHPMVADVLHELGYAYSVVDAFTQRLLPMHREEFGSICDRLEKMSIESDRRV